MQIIIYTQARMICQSQLITISSGSEQGQKMGQEPIRKIILQEALMLTVKTA